MTHERSRRDVLGLFGVGGLVFASALWGCGGSDARPEPKTPKADEPPPFEDFFFLQLSDTHWGYSGPANPEAATTLEHTVALINAAPTKPDFIVFTGDLTHTTDDVTERRTRMKRFREIVGGLGVPTLHFLPGEHDAAPDRGDVYRENFGDLHYAFDHKGVHFIALDNASQPGGMIGEVQLAWLESELRRTPKTTPIVVLAHRPLFDLAPEWEWATADGARAIELLQKRENVTVFYGHVHQELHRDTGGVQHHSARSLIFPLPVAGSQPKRSPLPWDPASDDHGLGYRSVALTRRALRVTEEKYRARVACGLPPKCDGPAAAVADVAPIVEHKCASCHAPGGVAEAHDFSSPASLARSRRAIGDEIAACAMPPHGAPPIGDADAAVLLRFACGTP